MSKIIHDDTSPSRAMTASPDGSVNEGRSEAKDLGAGAISTSLAEHHGMPISADLHLEIISLWLEAMRIL